jgi:hypothetical protein
MRTRHTLNPKPETRNPKPETLNQGEDEDATGTKKDGGTDATGTQTGWDKYVTVKDGAGTDRAAGGDAEAERERAAVASAKQVVPVLLKPPGPYLA